VRDQNEVHRIYDEQALASLLRDFEITECAFATQRNDHVWERCSDKLQAGSMRMTREGTPGAVALIVAMKN